MSAERIKSLLTGTLTRVWTPENYRYEIEYAADDEAIAFFPDVYHFQWTIRADQLCYISDGLFGPLFSGCYDLRPLLNCEQAEYALFSGRDTHSVITSRAMIVTVPGPAPASPAAPPANEPSRPQPSPEDIGRALGLLLKLNTPDRPPETEPPRPSGSNTSAPGSNACPSSVRARVLYCREVSEDSSFSGIRYFFRCSSRNERDRKTCGGNGYETTSGVAPNPYYCDPQSNIRAASIDSVIAQSCN